MTDYKFAILSKKDVLSAADGSLTGDQYDLITKATKADESARKTSIALYDATATTVPWTHLILADEYACKRTNKTVDRTGTDTFRNAWRRARIAGLGARAAKLLATPTKALNTAEKEERRGHLQVLTRYISADREALRKRQEPEYAALFTKKAQRAPTSKTAKVSPLNIKKTGDDLIDEENAHRVRAAKRLQSTLVDIQKRDELPEAELKQIASAISDLIKQLTAPLNVEKMVVSH